MADSTAAAVIVRFGAFEVDLRAKDLRRAGLRVRLPEQSFAVLDALLEQPGEVVTRDALRLRLWPGGTFVEFDDGLNHAVGRLRRALGDVSGRPVFIETVPKRGYRFIAPVSVVHASPPAALTVDQVPAHRAPHPRRSAVMTAMVLVVAFAGLAVLATRPSKPGPAIGRTARITTAPGLEHAPAWSPDGDRLAYAADAGGHMAIWVRPWSSGEAWRLTESAAAHDANPAWSPDGAWLAFASTRAGGGIFVAPSGGGPARRIVPLTFTPSADLIGSVPTLAWSPDGAHLAYAHGVEGRTALFIVGVAGGEPERIPMPADVRAFSIVQPAWSPDGRQLAFAALSGTLRTVARIWTIRRDGTDPRALTGEDSLNLQPQWIADGTRLFFLSDRGGSTDVYWMPVDGRRGPPGGPTPLTAGIGIGSFAVSRDGARLAYSKKVERSNIWTLPLDDDRSAAWAMARPLTSDSHTVEFVELSRDLQWLIFDSTRAGRSGIWRMRVDGSGLTRLTSTGADDWHPTISPDAARIAFHRLDNGNREIWTAPAAGGTATKLTDHPAKDWLPRWSPAADLIAFGSDREGQQDVFVVPAAGGSVRRLTDDPANDHNPIWSADGQAILFASNREGRDDLFVVPIEGGAARRLTRRGWEDVVPLVWRGDTIYVWARGEDEAGYWTVDPVDGAARLLLSATPASRQLGISLATDGRRLFFPVWERTAELWIAELGGVSR